MILTKTQPIGRHMVHYCNLHPQQTPVIRLQTDTRVGNKEKLQNMQL